MHAPEPLAAVEADVPDVSVVIPAYNAAGQISRLLQCLREQDLAAAKYEVIVVDDGSTDGTADFIRKHFPETNVLSVPNGGSYAARNAALKLVRGRAIAFTDADCAPQPSWLRRGLEALNAGSAELVAGAVVIDSLDPRSVAEFYDRSFGINQPFYVHCMGFGATANLFVKRSVVDLVKGFDASMRSGGDQVFCKTAVAAGARLIYCAEAVVHHEVRSTVRENFQKVIRIAKGVARITPRWRDLSRSRLSVAPTEYFDHAGFAKDHGLWFRLRFGCFYYCMALCWCVAYASEAALVRRGSAA